MLDRDRFPTDPWRLTETRFDAADAGRTETIFSLANGYLGLRGNHPEGRAAHEHGTFVNGFHETFPIQHAERAFGFAEVGQTIVNAPDAKIMRVYVDDEPLTLEASELLEYERTLDFRTGVLHRDLVWRTPSGKHVRIRMERMVSFTERHLAIQRLTVTVIDADAPVAISSQLVNRQDGQDVYGGSAAVGDSAGFDPRKAEQIPHRVLQPQDYWRDGDRTAMSYRTTSSGMSLAVVADHSIETENEHSERGQLEPDIAKTVYRVQAKAGVPITVTKTIAYHTSRVVPARELVDRCERTLDRVQEEGVEHQFDQQRTWLDAFWERSDVQIVGQEELQQATRWCLFQLAQAAARADALGVPAKGLTGSGYSGHYFWDTEIYVLPFLTYTSPQWARNALRMRTMMLPAARKRARMLNEAGALFPWRTINGEEASAYYAAGTAQYHINADISYALAKYERATHDRDFLYREGVDIAVETARMWATLGFWRQNGGDTFHIHGVTGPDEYTTVVNDNLYTNVMARFNLQYASDVVHGMASDDPEGHAAMAERLRLDPAEPELWAAAARSMAIPFSQTLGIHPQDAQFLEREVWDLDDTPADKRPLLLHFHPLVIYRFQVLKQADVVLALFLQGDQFTSEQKLADFDYYDPLTTGDSTLSAVVQSILAAEVGYRDLAMEYFTQSLFVDLCDLHDNSADGVHVASAGGVWTALVSGFGGMRDFGAELTFDPRLPAEWSELRYRLQWLGSSLEVALSQDSMTVRVISGQPVRFLVRGTEHTAAVGSEAVVVLDGQGPARSGRPTLDSIEDAFRADGSPLTASVPTTTAAVNIPDDLAER